ncbi:unnamed protein product, partial [Discosporangium mesarthrocarpum]
MQRQDESRPPVRSQAQLDAYIARKGDDATEREIRVPKTCASCPLDVLHLDDDFLIIGKPVDVRMDGEFDVTVEKLVRYWLPPLAEKELKWVHQLDFATSGVLCIGLNRQAAGRACQAFQELRAEKTYLAVVEGAVEACSYTLREFSGPEEAARWDFSPQGQPAGAGGDSQGDGTRGQRTKKGNPGVQYKPPHSFFVEEQRRLRHSLELSDGSSGSKGVGEGAGGRELSAEEMAVALTPWPKAKHNSAIMKPFWEASQRDREERAAQSREEEFRAAQGAPDAGIFRVPGDSLRTFRVDASVAQVPGDFRMRIGGTLPALPA